MYDARVTGSGLAALAASVLVAGCAGQDEAAAPAVTPAEARAIAKEAYVYGFPLVDNYRIQYTYFVDRENPEFKGSWNEVHNTTRVFTPEDTAIQTPNSDTPYSQLGADLRTEPVVITVPAVEKGRYYSLQFIDQYTHNFAYVGSRATGNGAGNYLLAGPGWKGEVPAGITAVIRSETQFDFVLFRTQLFSSGDIDKVRVVQDGYRAQTLSAFLGKPAPLPAQTILFPKPLTPEDQKSSPQFFRLLDFVLQFCPVHPSETDVRARFAKLGIGAQAFNFNALSPELQQAVRDGMADAWKEFAAYKASEIDSGKRPPAEAFGTREFLKNDYMARMAGAVLGIYGNSKEEALYPPYFVDAAKAPLDGRNRYRLVLTGDRMPPVNAFWSLTVYRMPESLLYDNPIDRYLINSPMLPTLKRGKGGSITLYLQHDSPGKPLDSNWLPVPEGPFIAIMRHYWPTTEALDCRWKQPPLERVD
jgi:hypothetical protein